MGTGWESTNALSQRDASLATPFQPSASSMQARRKTTCAYDSALDDEGERRYSDKGKLSRSVWWSVLRVWPPILSCFVLCRVVKRSGH